MIAVATLLAECDRHDDEVCRCPWRPPAWPDIEPIDLDALLSGADVAIHDGSELAPHTITNQEAAA